MTELMTSASINLRHVGVRGTFMFLCLKFSNDSIFYLACVSPDKLAQQTIASECSICYKKMSLQCRRDCCYYAQQFATNAINCQIENPILPTQNI